MRKKIEEKDKKLSSSFKPWNLWAIISPTGKLQEDSCCCAGHYEVDKDFIMLNYPATSKWVCDIDTPELADQWKGMVCQVCGYPTDQREGTVQE